MGEPLRWLHLSDIHMGCRGEEYWHHITERLLESVPQGKTPDLIFITGDITNSGQKKQYDQFNDFLKKLFDDAIIIPVPGNHDLVRPTKRWDIAKLSILENFSLGDDDPDIKELNQELWENEDPSFFTPLFANYQAWLEKSILPTWERRAKSFILSHFPGDFSLHLDLPDRPPLTVVGLNSSWRHYGDIEAGKLELFQQQLFFALGGSLNGLRGRNALLLMHHPPEWLSSTSLPIFRERIYPPNQFLACLHGHIHQGRSETTSISGGESRRYFQSHSLFGLEHYGTPRLSRAFGYTWGEMDHGGGIRVWPMKYYLKGDGAGKFIYDPDFEGDTQTGMVLREGSKIAAPPPLEEPKSTEIPSYCSWVLQTFGTVSLIGAGGADLRMELSKVYVPLRISQRSNQIDFDQRKERPGKVCQDQNEGEVKLEEIFTHGQGRHAALFGDPGSGKTTALRKLLHHCLTTGPSSLGLVGSTVPLFLRLRRF
ncbi:MAG: metallophosphoesterase, partial [Magnetococcales bacterium]|nr:metallophosphoesterase [Magnetococcales bacterium]